MNGNRVDASLKDLIATCKPRRILAIGPAMKQLLDDYLRDCPDCKLTYYETAPPLEKLALAHQFDLAVLSHSIEYLPRQAAQELLARLRDILSQRVVVVVPIGADWPEHASHWQTDDLLALGFTRVGRFRHADRSVQIFAYDMAHYKQTPDWLNSQYWANPELFGKYWW